MAALFRRKRSKGGRLREANKADITHLEDFARSRRGVEGFVEPRTAVTDTTLVLVAVDGEWTRRRVPGPKFAHEFANRLGIPSYDPAVVGYPDRMRQWNARRAKEQRLAERRRLGDSG